MADSYEIIRNGIRLTLDYQEEFIPIVTEAENGSQVIDLVTGNDFDIVLLDVEMPDIDGLMALRQLRDEGKKVPILALTNSCEELVIRQTIQLGAHGYIQKGASSNELLRAILAVSRNEVYYNRNYRVDQQQEYIDDGCPLTRRERQLVKLIASEYTTDEIASTLGISRRTVEGHKAKLKTKLQVRSSIGVVKYAYENGHFK